MRLFLEVYVAGLSINTINHIDTGAKTATGKRSPLWRTRLLDAGVTFNMHSPENLLPRQFATTGFVIKWLPESLENNSPVILQQSVCIAKWLPITEWLPISNTILVIQIITDITWAKDPMVIALYYHRTPPFCWRTHIYYIDKTVSSYNFLHLHSGIIDQVTYKRVVCLIASSLCTICGIHCTKWDKQSRSYFIIS